MMNKERLYLFDTTLRDGAQTSGVDFSVEDKLLITRLLDDLGLDYIEGGYPGANKTDDQLFAKKPELKNAKFTAFGMTRRPGRSVENDPGLNGILNAQSDAICLVAKSWDYHVDVALNTTNEENIACIEDSVKAVIKSGRESLIDCEHFFDGYKANPDYALACAKAAYDNGARWVVLCDTNGGIMPSEIGDIVFEVTKHIPGSHLGIHTHNDTENAVANSLMAVKAGVRQIQGTLNGLGERCGNANLVSIIPSLILKNQFAEDLEVGISEAQLAGLSKASRTLDMVLNRQSDRHAPYVGRSAFTHKGGIHVSAVQKDPKTYEHVAPEAVGNKRRLVVSDQAGRSNIIAELERLNIDIDKNDDKVGTLLSVVKEREGLGYAYEDADASFELLAKRTLGTVPDFFLTESFKVLTERHKNDMGENMSVSEATVKVLVDGTSVTSVGEGNGPVNALDHALRSDLGKYQPYIDDLELVDYQVRILTGGTQAVTRVLIESGDKKGNRWFTVGVSPNLVDASFQALVDSIRYKLLRDGAPA